MPSIASRTQRRKSVATWSLRLRAVCRRRPASPMRSASRASMFMWMSSSASSNGKVPASISAAMAVEAGVDGGRVGGGDDADMGQHGGVGTRAGDVLPPEALVEADGGVDAPHDVGRRGGEAAAPLGVRGAEGVCRGSCGGGYGFRGEVLRRRAARPYWRGWARAIRRWAQAVDLQAAVGNHARAAPGYAADPGVHGARPASPSALDRFRGRPVVLNFWATWCAPCVAELPELDKLAASGALTVLAVSADRARGGGGEAVSGRSIRCRTRRCCWIRGATRCTGVVVGFRRR